MAILWTYSGKFSCYWAYFHCCNMAKCFLEIAIWSHRLFPQFVWKPFNCFFWLLFVISKNRGFNRKFLSFLFSLFCFASSVTRFDFATWAKFKKSLAISWVTILYLAKLWTYSGKYFILLGKFSLLKMAAKWKLIYPSVHTVLPLDTGASCCWQQLRKPSSLLKVK